MNDWMNVSVWTSEWMWITYTFGHARCRCNKTFEYLWFVRSFEMHSDDGVAFVSIWSWNWNWKPIVTVRGSRHFRKLWYPSIEVLWVAIKYELDEVLPANTEGQVMVELDGSTSTHSYVVIWCWTIHIYNALWYIFVVF